MHAILPLIKNYYMYIKIIINTSGGMELKYSTVLTYLYLSFSILCYFALLLHHMSEQNVLLLQ